MPQPIIFVRMAITSKITEKMIMFVVIPVNVTLIPMLAKKIGDKNIYERISNLRAMYLECAVFEITTPAIKAPVTVSLWPNVLTTMT